MLEMNNSRLNRNPRPFTSAWKRSQGLACLAARAVVDQFDDPRVECLRLDEFQVRLVRLIEEALSMPQDERVD